MKFLAIATVFTSAWLSMSAQAASQQPQAANQQSRVISRTVHEGYTVTVTEVPVPAKYMKLYREAQLFQNNNDKLTAGGVNPRLTVPGPRPQVQPKPTLPGGTLPPLPQNPNLPPTFPQPGGNNSGNPPWNPLPPYPGGGLGGIGGVSDWIYLGQRIWDMIQSLAGQMRIEPMTGVGVLPASASAMADMSSWKVAAPKAYKMEVAGSFGTAFSFTYTIGFNYGGKYRGKGAFLANVSVLPYDVKCAFSWNCSLSATVGTGFNVGTDEDPIAALPLNLLVNAQGRVNAKAIGAQFTVYGDGRLEKTVSPR